MTHVGIHLSNRQWAQPQLNDSDRRLLTLMAPGVTAAKMFSYHRLDSWQAVDALLHPKMWVVRINDLSDLPKLAAIYAAGYRDVVAELGNEPNHPTAEPWGGDINRFLPWYDEAVAWLHEYCPEWRICTPGLSPSFDLAGWLNHPEFRRRAERADYVGAHGYYQQDIATAVGHVQAVCSAYPGRRILATEVCCTAGESGMPRDRAVLATEYGGLARRIAGFVDALFFFILGSDDPRWSQVNETFDEGMARAIGAINLPQGEGTMSIAVAIIPSNQDRNTGAIPGYSEMGGMMGQLGPRLLHVLASRGIEAVMIDSGPESIDKTPLENLHRQCRAAKARLSESKADVKLALSLHTNAVGKDKTPFSHTAYLWETEEARRLGEAVAKRVQKVLGTKQLLSIKSDRYVYQVDLEPFVSALLEVCAHDYRPDLDALYAKVDAVAEAIADGILDYVGQPTTVDYRAELERMRRELEAATTRLADANRRLGEHASIAKAAISMMEKIRG
jgi:N-acetylmuramoyl-L-alanine amidase